MKEIKLYLCNNLKDPFLHTWDDAALFKTINVSDDIDLWGEAIKIDDKYYRICLAKGSSKYAIEELEKYEPEETESLYKDNITCPICGYTDTDSWECEDNGKFDCPQCGAELSYERYVEVTYCTTVEKVSSPIEL